MAVAPRICALAAASSTRQGPGVDTTIRYRYRTHDNETSEVYTTHITGSDSKNLRSWQRTFGAAGSRGSAAASGAGGKRVIDGWVKLEILDGNNIEAEDRAEFSLSCEPQRTKSEPPPDATPVVATLSLPDLVIQAANERDARTLTSRSPTSALCRRRQPPCNSSITEAVRS